MLSFFDHSLSISSLDYISQMFVHEVVLSNHFKIVT